MDVTTTQGTCRVISSGHSGGPAHVLDAGLSSGQVPRLPAQSGEGGPGRCHPQLLSAQTNRQAVPCVRVFFPPPTCAIILVVSPAAHRGPHASTAHGAVAATLAVVVRAFHGQLHATVLLKRRRQTGTLGASWERHQTPLLQEATLTQPDACRTLSSGCTLSDHKPHPSLPRKSGSYSQ